MVNYTPFWLPFSYLPYVVWGLSALAVIAVVVAAILFATRDADSKLSTVVSIVVAVVLVLAGAGAWGVRYQAKEHVKAAFAQYHAIPDDPLSTPDVPGPYQAPYMLKYVSPKTGKETPLFCGIRYVPEIEGKQSYLRISCWLDHLHNGDSVKPDKFDEKLGG